MQSKLKTAVGTTVCFLIRRSATYYENSLIYNYPFAGLWCSTVNCICRMSVELQIKRGTLGSGISGVTKARGDVIAVPTAVESIWNMDPVPVVFPHLFERVACTMTTRCQQQNCHCHCFFPQSTSKCQVDVANIQRQG